MMIINLTFIISILLVLLTMYAGIKSGLTKGVIGTVTMFVLYIMTSLGLKMYHSFQAGRVLNVIIAFVLLSILGAGYGLLKLVFKCMKSIANLPIIHFLDKVLGGAFGICIGIILIEIIFVAAFYNHVGAWSYRIIDEAKNNNVLATLYRYNFFVK